MTTHKPRSLKSKIVSQQKLATILKSKHARAKTVFTNGCYDLLHLGHVTLLEKARGAGDLLIVALNTDQSVQRLKGKGRPLNALKIRAAVMAAIESVDYVTWFDEDTPLKAILKLKPKVLVKGGDYKADSIVGAREVKQWNGKVKIIPFVKGQSTTGLIAKFS